MKTKSSSIRENMNSSIVPILNEITRIINIVIMCIMGLVNVY